LGLRAEIARGTRGRTLTVIGPLGKVEAGFLSESLLLAVYGGPFDDKYLSKADSSESAKRA